jgi:hypothetical protein
LRAQQCRLDVDRRRVDISILIELQCDLGTAKTADDAIVSGLAPGNDALT